MRVKLIIGVVLSTLFGTACAQSADGRFTIEAIQANEECLGRVFPFEPEFLASRARTDSVGIFLQSRGGAFQFADVISFEVFEPNTIEQNVAYDLELIATRTSRIVSAVELGESCANLDDSLGLEGTLEFSQWSQDPGGIISAHVEGQIRSLRTGEVVADGVEGDFQFHVQVGQPFEEFRN